MEDEGEELEVEEGVSGGAGDGGIGGEGGGPGEVGLVAYVEPGQAPVGVVRGEGVGGVKEGRGEGEGGDAGFEGGEGPGLGVGDVVTEEGCVDGAHLHCFGDA